jgi:RimJ/RimL family protein N-acetyltransferase
MRPVSEADVTLFCDLYGDPATMRFVGPPLSRERAQRSFRVVLASLDREPLERLFMVIIEKAIQRAVGIGSYQQFDSHGRRVEAGMVLNSESRVRGFGKEGLHALITHAFAMFPVDEVWIQHAADNAIARGVPVRLGLLPATDLLAYGVEPGKCVWSAYRESWCVTPGFGSFDMRT